MGLTARVTARGPSADQLAGPDAARHLAALRAQAPVSRVDAVGGWLVTGYAAAVAVMRDATTYTVDDPRFSTGRVVGPSMLSTDGAEHHRHRRPFAAAYRPSRVEQAYAAATRTLADDLLDRVRPQGSADLRPTLAGPLSVRVMARVLDLVDVDACLAMDLARLEAGVAVQTVAALPGVRLERAEPSTGLVFRKPASVQVAWEPATSGRAR